MLMTSSDHDLHACPLPMTVHVVQMPLSERTDALCRLATSEGQTFHWLVSTALSTPKCMTQVC
jgi:hypothetical protein